MPGSHGCSGCRQLFETQEKFASHVCPATAKCQKCEAQILKADLEQHVQNCTGPPIASRLSSLGKSFKGSAAVASMSALAVGGAKIAQSKSESVIGAERTNDLKRVVGETSDIFKKRLGDMKDMAMSPEFKEFCRNPSAEQLALHPEYLTQTVQILALIRHPKAAAYNLLLASTMEASQKEARRQTERVAADHISKETGGFVSPQAAQGALKQMSPEEMKQLLSIAAQLGMLGAAAGSTNNRRV
eukprot:gb/GEZN01017318.1/.p1 GENE.gb/GEZN01017318.1/~~gb/GEZN01017318.1/.p1  ORF type:complete len:244 (-),score=26.29 gb/GEZN01017318.1/:51-782(-)